MIRRLRNLLSGPEPDDFLPGDFVRRIGFPGTGLVESVLNNHAVVAWDMDKRDVLPFGSLRRIKPRGHRFDSRSGI